MKPEKRSQGRGQRTRSEGEEGWNLGEGGGVWSREEAVPGQCQPGVRNLSGQPSPAGQSREAFQKGPKPGDVAAGEKSQHYIPDRS